MKKSLLTILCTLLSVFSWAQGTTAGDGSAETYAVLTDNQDIISQDATGITYGKTLTFYYDANKTSHSGAMSVGPFDYSSGRSWDLASDSITSVVFDGSFANCTTLTSTAFWFQGCERLTTIMDISNLKTDNVTDMRYMFYHCSSLTGLDVSNFSTANVTTMRYMFGASGLTSIDISNFNTANVTDVNSMFIECSNLTTIYAGSQWSTAAVMDGNRMFQSCTSLVGGAGTPYDANHTDYTYAHIDGGENNPGYFTEKNASYNEAYAVLVSEDGGNIMYATLYYDGNKASHTEGFAVVGLDEMLQNQAWMMNRSNIKTVNFDESFANCNPTSTAYWFAFCNSLTAINGLQYLNTEYVTNMEYMFHMCPALTSIDLSHFRAKSLTNMNAMFGGCSSLTSLDLSGFFTFTVTNMNYLFSGCTNLKTIYVNKYDWSTESVTAGDGVFENCTSLVGGAGTTFNDSHIDYTYARIDGGPDSQTPGYFTDIDASASVVAPEFRFEGDNLAMTTETQNASIFYKVAELPSMAEAVVDSVRNSLVVTPDGQQSTYYEHPFELKMAAVVKAIAVADNATGTIVSDTTTMVYDYEAWVNLKAAVTSGVDLYGRAQGNPNVDTQLLEQLQWALNEGDMIYNNRAQMDSYEATHFTQRINELCAQIEAQMAAEDEPYAVLSENNTILTFYYDTNKSAYRDALSVGPFDGYATRWDGHSADITTVVFDASFANDTILSSTSNWFHDCSNLTNLTGLEYLNTSNVTDMSLMFQNCSNLLSIDVSKFNTAKVINMEHMFMGCSALTSLDLNNFNTANVTNMGMMFFGCSGLSLLNVSSFNTANVTNMYGMFDGCSSLTSLDVSSFNTANVTNIQLMFSECGKLTSLDLSSFNTANVTKMDYLFYSGTSELTTIYVGSGWTTESVTSGGSMFTGCLNLVGGKGTAYANNSDHNDYTYARIDGGPNSTTPGYFTDKNAASNLERDADGNYLLRTADDWKAFASVVVNTPTASAKMMTDIDLGDDQTMIGSSSIPYQGTFDGQKYTLTVNLLDEGQVAPFRYVQGATIQNLRVKGKIEATKVAVGGIIATVLSGATTTLSHCWSSSQLASGTTETEQNTIGGFVAGSEAELIFEDCLFDGKIDEKNYRYNGGFVADMLNNLTIRNSLNVGEYTSVSQWANWNGTFYRPDQMTHTATLENVYYKNVYGTAQGTQATSTQLSDGTTTGLLQNGRSEEIWVQGDANPVLLFNGVTAKVATPTFSWRNDELTMSCTTEGAAIMYLMSDEDTNGDGVVTDADYKQYSAPIEVKRDVFIKALAIKEGMVTSDTISLDYPYQAWSRLYDVCIYGRNIIERASRSSRVPEQMRLEAETYITVALDLYSQRTASRDEVEDITSRLAYILSEIERMMEIQASYSNGVLYIEGNTTLTEALQKFSGSSLEKMTAIVSTSSEPITNNELLTITNPNLLIYVQSDAQAPANRDNVIVNGFAKNIVLTDVENGYNDFYCPQSFTAEAISYTREFKQKTQIGVSRGWETIALPFNVQTIMHETRGLITPFGNNRSNTHFWLRRLTHDGLQSDSIIEANTAYLISMPNSEEYVAEYNLPGRVTFSAENATVPMTEIVKDESADYVMTPCFTNAAAKQGIYVLNVGEQRSGYPEGSIFESNYRAVLPFQAYVEHKGSNPAPPYFIVGDLGGDTTGIDATLVNSERVNSEAWYTLDGRKLQGKPTQKGVYITNGKKVIIK